MEDRQNIGVIDHGSLKSTSELMDAHNDLDSTGSLDTSNDTSKPSVEIDDDNLLDEVVDIDDVDASNENDGNNVIEPMDIFVVQPDGTKVRISFLANGEFISDPHILLTDSDCESSTFSENVIIPDSDNLTDVSKGSEIIATFVNAESSQQVSAIQMADGQIYYIESFAAPILEPSYELLNSSEDLKLCTVNPTIIEESSMQEVMETNTSKHIANYKTKFKKLPSNKLPKTHQTESSVLLVGDDLMIEDKLQMVEYMMPRQRRRFTYIKVPQEENEKEKGTYNCDMCNASYPKAKQFYGHSRTHTKERQLHCTLCADKKVFSAHGKLNRHERRFHTNVREHECAVCNAKFDRASQLGYHMRRVHMNERSHVCSFCQKAFFKLSDLKSHINIHLGLYSNVCHTCGKKFNHISNLNRHLLTHSGVKPYPCSKCGRRFNQPSGLANHKLSHDPQKRVPCKVCRKMFKNGYVMKRHMKLMHKDVVLDDTETDTNEEVPMTYNHPKTRNFYCKVCGDTFPFSVLLKNHERSHEKEDNFHCVGCKQDLASIELLKNHSCQSPLQRAQRAAAVEAEQVALSSQLENLISIPEYNDENGTGEIVIYVTVDGLNQSTLIHSIKCESNSNSQFAEDEPSTIFDHFLTEPTEEEEEEQINQDHKELILLFDQSSNPSTEEDPSIVEGDQTSTTKDNNNTVLVESENYTNSIDNREKTSPIHDNTLSELVDNGTPLSSSDVGAETLPDKENKRALLRLYDSVSELNVCDEHSTSLDVNNEGLSELTERDRTLTEFSVDEDRGNGLPLKLNNVRMSLMMVDPMKLEQEPSSPLLSLDMTEHENSEDNFLTDNNGLSRDDEVLVDEHSVDRMSVFKENTVQQTSKIADVEENPTEADTDPTPETKKTPAKVYECLECNKTFLKNGNFRQHLGIHFADQQRYSCSICFQSFAWKSTMNKHMIKHDDGPKQMYSCDICNREYGLQIQVQNHIKRDHYKERSHKCSYCGKGFFKKHDLTVHIRTHTLEKPYICKLCGKRFYHVSHIIRHEQSHTKLKRFSCQDCGRFYTQASSLKVHQQMHSRCVAKTVMNLADELIMPEFTLTEEDDSNILVTFYHSNNLPPEEVP